MGRGNLVRMGNDDAAGAQRAEPVVSAGGLRRGGNEARPRKDNTKRLPKGDYPYAMDRFDEA